MSDDDLPRTPKAYAYVVRETTADASAETTRELLLFYESGTSGAQVPKGGVEGGENPREAVEREAHEEAGLTAFENVDHVATDEWDHPRKEKVYVRHFFRLDVAEAPDDWTHRVTGNGSDEGDVYEFFWSELLPDEEVAADMDDYLDDL